MSLSSELKGAKIKVKDTKNNVTIAWFGGHGIHAYNEYGEEIGFWNTGDFSKDHATEEEVKRSIRQAIKEGGYY